MELKIVVSSGEEAGVTRKLAAGQQLRIGRTPPAELCIPDDSMMSSLHFSLEVKDDYCALNDLGSKFGTQVNGKKITTTELQNGDKIGAGNTSFTIQIVGETRLNHQPVTDASPVATPIITPAPAESPAPPHPGKREVLAYFQALAATTTVFCIMDAAREATILNRLNKHGEQCQSLYEGEKGESLAPFGPWLVRLPAASKLLAEFVEEGWGQSWGVYLTSTLSFADVRKHFRHFLKVLLPDGRQVYFRYYDPRVLRTYLGSSAAHELRDFYGSIQRYLMETAEGDGILEFTPHSKGGRRITVSSPE